jgi:hypothetical protein
MSGEPPLSWPAIRIDLCVNRWGIQLALIVHGLTQARHFKSALSRSYLFHETGMRRRGAVKVVAVPVELVSVYVCVCEGVCLCVCLMCAACV